MRALIMTVLVFVAAIPVSSQDEPRNDTGNYILEQCTALVNFLDTSEQREVAKVTHCVGYIEGTVQTYRAIRLRQSVTYEDWAQKGPLGVCMPDVTVGQVTRVVVKYLREHPADLHHNAGTLTMDALADAFPCKKVTP